MKIIELHIRNIASIEQADINFDTDLIDRDTNLPAQKFLIYGDTGTGKSILLDSIALSLFKKTPRIEGLEGKRQNKFTNQSGNEVNISSIEQYTRLGISEKDNSYCEVIFIANNGGMYHVRLELGFTKGKDKKLKYRKPNWILKPADGDWEKVDNKGEAIEVLIGMTFEQFNRMAMLAQGQFASFLCGDKNERADILERLTNTEIFSRYGEVIKELTKKKESATQIASERFEIAKQFLLNVDEVAQLEAHIKADSSSEQTVATERKTVEETLYHIQARETAVQNIAAANTQLTELQSIIESFDYRTKQNLLSDWDHTDQERKELEQLQQNYKKLESARVHEESLRVRFANLSAGLLHLENDLHKKEVQIGEMTAWLSARNERSTLYENAKITCEKLEQYKQQQKNIQRLQADRDKAQKHNEQLYKEQVAALASFKEATSTLQQRETLLISLKKEFNELNPILIDESLQRLIRLTAAFERLRDDYLQLQEQQQEQQMLRKRFNELEINLKETINLQKQVQKTYHDDSLYYERTMKQYSTLNSSLEETLVGLRQKMEETHTEICPLCGQHINSILTSSEFANVILPYKVAQEQAKKQVEQSQDQLHKTNDTLSSIRAQLQVTNEQLKVLSDTIEKNTANINERLQKSGLEDTTNIQQEIEKQLLQAQQENATLVVKKQKATDIQKEIELKSEELQPYEQQQRQAEQRVLKNKNDIEHNVELIKSLDIQLCQAFTILQEQEQTLHTSLQIWFPDWCEQPENTARLLSEQATEFLIKKSDLNTATQLLKNKQELIGNMHNIQRNILVDRAEWKTLTTQQQISTDTKEPSLNEWNQLSNECSNITGIIHTYNDAIRHSLDILNVWQRQTGKTIDDLKVLMERRNELKALRQEFIDIESNRTTWVKKLQDAEDALQRETNLLHQTYADELPEKDILIARSIELQNEETAIHDRLVKAQERLSIYLNNKQKAEEAQQAFEQAKRVSDHWGILNKHFGGERFRNLVQTHILRPLLQSANSYLRQITDRYQLTCSEDNEQLAILVADRYNRNELRSATILSGGEKFMISLALSLALSSLNRPDMNVNILFIDEGFGTLDQKHLDSVMKTLGSLQEIAAQSGRRVGIISHREELLGCIPNKIKLTRMGEGRSKVETVYEW